MPNDALSGQDALVVADTLDLVSTVLKRSVSRALVAPKTDPLSPTPFTGSATGAIEKALGNVTQLSFTQEELDAVKLAIDAATEHENRMNQGAQRALQVMQYVKPLVSKILDIAL